MENNTMHFQDKEEWRSWLSRNHDTEKEAWLIIRKKHSPINGVSYDEALEEAICFGWIDGKMQSIDGDRFVLRFSPRKARSIWSKRNRNKAEILIEQGRMSDAGLARIKEARQNGFWQTAYSSRTGETIPPDLERALSANKTARDNFHNLANTYRNMFIRWLESAATEEARVRRIEEIVKLAEANRKMRYGSLKDEPVNK